MNKLLLIGILLLLGCKNFVPLAEDSDNLSHINPKNDKFFLYFEQNFKDSISVTYDEKTIFNEYVSTTKRLAAANEFCKIESIKKGALINLKIGKKVYIIKPLNGYRYYYLTKFNDKVAATYSNVLREYY